jgi:hypothetical protein
LKKQPHLVILAYFEGNDLYDAASYERATPLILFRFARYALNRSLESWRGPSLGAAQAEAAPDYLYPVRITINNRDLETAFLSYYLSWLSVDREAIETSQDFRLTSETILRMRELSEEAGAQFLLVYVPSKEHVYLPYLTDADTLARVFADVPTIELDETGFLQFVDGRATPELTRQQMDAQARLLADFAVDNNIRFLDLTPIFHEEAGRATELYYPFDTHWNQLGHDLAAQSINAYIQEMLSDASDEAAGP